MNKINNEKPVFRLPNGSAQLPVNSGFEQFASDHGSDWA
jgi:hypothetical protein